MRWPWCRKRKADEAALAEAERDLAEVRARWPQVKRAAESMHEHRRRNHFGENIAAIYSGRRP